LRCAIDDKPTYYRPLINGQQGQELWGTSTYVETSLNNLEKVDFVCDWRELIY
jgi:hypothetical protein